MGDGLAGLEPEGGGVTVGTDGDDAVTLGFGRVLAELDGGGDDA